LPYVNWNIMSLAEPDIDLNGWQNGAVPNVLESDI
jgi:hypothetical protein